MDVEQITDFECVKDHICFKLVNREKNAEPLKNAPYIEYKGLVVIFFVLVSKGSSAATTIAVLVFRFIEYTKMDRRVSLVSSYI